jgi:tetratricopeptide (TPR) repeat protein
MVSTNPCRRAPAFFAVGLAAVLAVPAVGQEPGAPAAAPTAPAATPAPAPIPVSVLAVPFPIFESPDAQVPLLVEVNGPGLLAGNTGGELAGEIRASATAESGAVVEEIVQPFVLDPADERLQRGLELFAMMRLGPGRYALRVTVTNATNGAVGAWQGSLQVPEFLAGETTVSPPLFPQAPDFLRVFRQSESRHDELPYPFEGVGGEAFLPAVSPITGGEGTTFNVFLYNATGSPQRLSARLTDGAGQSFEVPIEVLGMASGAAPGQRKLALRLNAALPAPGSYRLDLGIGMSGGASVTTTTPLSVVAEAPPAPEALGLVGLQETAAADEPAVLGRDWSPEALHARYRELLLRATAEGFEPVARELSETELSATADRKGGQIKALREVETAVLDSIGGGGADSLLPVAYLHYVADIEYLRRNQGWMAAQNRVWVSMVVERWLARNGDAASRRVAAQLLAVLGSSRDALELDPVNELALLRLASSAEKGGQFDEAADLMRRLVSAHPESHHGRLRLGVALARAGNGAEASRALAPLLENEEVPRWIAGIAYQEAAAVERAARRHERAEQLLRKGIERVGTQGLYLQLAYYLDERQRPDESVAALNAMPVEDDVESSGRFLYNDLPAAEIAAARREVEARLGEGVSQLRLALAAAPAATAGSR